MCEFSMFLFVTWVLVLVAYHFIRKYQENKVTKISEDKNCFVEDETFVPQKTENIYIKKHHSR